MGLPPMAGYDVILQSKNKKLTLGLTGVFKLDDMKLSNSYSVSAGFVGTRCAKGPGRDHDLCRSVLRRPSLLSTLLRDGNWYTALEPQMHTPFPNGFSPRLVLVQGNDLTRCANVSDCADQREKTREWESGHQDPDQVRVPQLPSESHRQDS